MSGQAKILEYFVIGLTTIGFILILFFFTTGRYVEIKNVLKENTEQRLLINLAQVILSSDEFVYSDGIKYYRAIFDEEKLSSLDQNDLFTTIKYPGYKYSLEVKDLENNKIWHFGDPIIESMVFPVAIRYSDDEIHIGKLFISLESV